MKRALVFLAVLLTAFMLFAGGDGEDSANIPATVEEWEQWAQIGDYRPAEDDWAAIEAAAKEEGSVVVYSNSSRVYEFCRTFYEKYGIKAEGTALKTPNLIEKVGREQDAEVYSVDVIMTGNATQFVTEFAETGKVYKFVPSDIQPLLYPDAAKEQLAIHHYGAKVVMYNTERYSEPPIDSWWDLTRPEWKGKLITVDPLKSGTEFNLFALFVRHADEMAALYKQEFGEEIVLHDTPNAGYEFLLRFIQNEPVLLGGGGDVAGAVGAKGQSDPPLGVNSYSKLRTADENNLSLSVIADLAPATGISTKSTLSISKYAAHPNAAKLLIRWMMGGAPGGEDGLAGYEPYHVLGDWSPRSDITEPEGQIPFKETGLWEEDIDWLYQHQVKIRDFWIQHM